MAALALLIAVGVALRRLATLAAGDDLALVRDLAGDRTAALTTIAHAVSWLGRSWVLVPAAAIAAAVAAGAGRRPGDGLVVLVGVVGAVVIQDVVKGIVQRPRPPVTWLEHVSGTSFPSGHATEAAGFFVALALVAARGSRSAAIAGGAAAVIVAAVALSRVYMGVHYPTDVVAGILLGGAWGVVSWTVLAPPGTRRLASPAGRPARPAM